MSFLDRLFGGGRVRGVSPASTDAGRLWRPDGGRIRALVICFTPDPAAFDWLAGSLALRLGAEVLVAARLGDPTASLAAARSASDALPVAVVGEADAAPAAIEAARASGARLALLYPAALDGVEPAGIPTTLIQAAGSGAARPEVVRFDRALRLAGVAVRETEYADVTDGWARRRRRSSGSARALDDLVAFLDRGIGQASTFDVIPGWDLH